MNGLSELNTFGSQTVTVSDSRKARIVFESENTSKNSEISFGNGVFTFRITKDLYPFVIQEIINYQTCLPKLYITIKPSSVSGTTISQTLEINQVKLTIRHLKIKNLTVLRTLQILILQKKKSAQIVNQRV